MGEDGAMLGGWTMLVPLVIKRRPLRFRHQQKPMQAQQQHKSTMTTMMIKKIGEPMPMVIVLQTSSL